MIHDHRPLFIKHLFGRFEKWYGAHFIAPQFKSLGRNWTLLKPWRVDIHGGEISAGENLHIITAKDRRVSFSTWQFGEYQGHIEIGNSCLICPGVRLDSGSHLKIGDNCMLAAGSYVTDADWHDIYDRTKTVGETRPVTLSANVWIGDGAVVCKGVTIGENSVIGAGAVVASDIPANVVAAGNPAKVIKQLDPEREFTTRAAIFEDVAGLNRELDKIDRYVLGNNSLLGWIRSLVQPRRGD